MRVYTKLIDKHINLVNYVTEVINHNLVVVVLLTVVHIGGAEDYCNCFFMCQCICPITKNNFNKNERRCKDVKTQKHPNISKRRLE